MNKFNKIFKLSLLVIMISILGYTVILSFDGYKFSNTIFSLLPSLIAIILALLTKEVYSSLFLGIVSGALLLNNFNLIGTLKTIIDKGIIKVTTASENVYIILFLIILGIIVILMNKSGGSKKFGDFTLKKIKTRVGAQLMSIAMGIIIFIDDYFNCLTVGSVMRPVCDEHEISRAKLAYLIDATAAPVCVLAPISSWAAAVAGFIPGVDGFSAFIESIPYNFYAIFTIVMMLGIVFVKVDYANMAEYEKEAAIHEDLSKVEGESEKLIDNPKGKIIDLVFPIITLIICCFIGLIYTGGFFNGKNLFDAFSNCNGGQGLVYGSSVALLLTICFYTIRRVLTFNDVSESIGEGFKSIVSAIIILVLAWTLKEMTDNLHASVYVASLMKLWADKLMIFLPCVIFIVSSLLAFATGTSWGTFGILIPIVVGIFNGDNSQMMIIALSSCMAGAVCGDHCSPISDTTIMASTGAKCNHLIHVTTQLWYVLPVAIISALMYVLAAVIKSPIIPLIIGVILIISFLIFMKKRTTKQI